jgi:hypothetical protein
VLLVAFRADTHALIPLYAVGVFLAFTLSQAAMVVHWRRHHGRRWRRSLVANATGAVLAAIVLLVELGTKFAEGAWLVAVVVPLLVYGAGRIRKHYGAVRAATTPSPADVVAASSADPSHGHALSVVLVRRLDRPALRALAYATRLGQPQLAVHLSPSSEEREEFLDGWRRWGDHVRLEILDSPYRAEVAPVAAYVRALSETHPDVLLTVVLPELVVGHGQRALHDHAAARLRRALRDLPGVVVTTVPFHVDGAQADVLTARSR